MKYIVLGTFEDRESVASMIGQLEEEGYSPKDISIVLKDSREAKELESDTGADVAGGAVTGATTGAVLGGLAGLLSAALIPGLGAFFIGGPIAAALGLTGTAAATVSGAATGLAAGGIVGALTGLGLSSEEAKRYESRIEEGAILVAVPAIKGEEMHVKDVFNDYDATDITTINTSEVESIYQDDVKGIRTHGRSEPTYAFGAKGGRTREKKRTT